MIWELSDAVWFGDKPSVGEGRNRVKSVINVSHSIRRPYWQDVSRLHWEVWYFRLALPDREVPDSNYLFAFEQVVKAIDRAGKYPLLCHCRMGGHRGPTAALFAFWAITGRKGGWFESAYRKVVELRPSYGRERDRAVYRNVILQYCRENSL